MRRSVMLSSDEVASSSSSTGAFLSTARATATRCFSPPLSLRPRSPTTVSYFCGKRSTMWSCRAAARQASRTCSSLALRSP
mmetsp:Transcript_14978/g.62344  ORF Transcript_14978/g.62344 Transcript_14978/m.62344 type:complete len:81 (-) Transcript_14978:1485-1727(-)